MRDLTPSWHCAIHVSQIEDSSDGCLGLQPARLGSILERCISKLFVNLLDYRVLAVAEWGSGHWNRAARAPDLSGADGVAGGLD
jgi:hypothetical protein